MKYRKRPVVVEAIQYKEPLCDNINDIKNFTNMIY